MLRRNSYFFNFNFFGFSLLLPIGRQREQPIGGLKQFVRARVCSAWRVEVRIIFESANFGMCASITGVGPSLSIAAPQPQQRALVAPSWQDGAFGVDGLPTSLVRPNWLYELSAMRRAHRAN